MSYGNRQFLADQLQAAAPEAEWDASGVNRADELAGIFLRHGVKDLGNLGLVKVTRREQAHAWTEPVQREYLAFAYHEPDGRIRRFGFMGTQDRHDQTDFLDPSGAGLLAAWSSAGKGHVNYVVVPRSAGFAIVPRWGSSSDAASIRETVLVVGSMVVMFALPAAGISAANAIGSAVIGPTAAASYPALANAIGNVALSTAFNGGNIKQAAQGAALAYAGGAAGGAVGGAVSNATNTQILGDLANLATRTYIQGGDVDQAVKRALIQKGLSMDWMTDTLRESIAPPMTADASNFPTAVDSYGGSGSFFDPWSFGSTSWGGSGFDFTFSDLSNVGFSTPILESNFPTPAQFNPQTDSSFGWSDFRDVVNNVSYAALAALKLNAAYQQVRNPSIAIQAQRVAANGVVTTALDTGVIQTRQPDGRVTMDRPPVGVPHSTVTGNVIVNNGNGTFDLIDPAGNRRTLPYGASSGGTLTTSPLLGGFGVDSIPPVAIVGALGLLALFLGSRRR